MMWLKDKLIRNIVFSVVGLGLLAGAYYFVQNIPDKDNPATPTPSPWSDTQLIEVFKYKLEDIKEVYIKNIDDEYTIEKIRIKVSSKNENGTEDIKEKDSWRIKEFQNIEYNSTKLENAVYDFASVNADKEIEETDNLSQFGLDMPQAEFTVYLNDGNARTIYLGNKVAGGSGYFIKDKNSEKVYTVATYKAEAMLKVKNDYRDNKLAEINAQALSSFTLYNKGNLVADIRLINEDEKEKFSMLAAYVMTKPRYESVSADNFGKVLENIGTIEAAEFIEDFPKNLAKYGLDNPSLVITLADDQNNVTIKYGNRTDDNKIYAMIGDKDVVFTQDIKMYETLAKIETLALIEKFTHIINIEKVKDVIIEGAGKKFTLSIEGETDSQTYFANGVNANEDAFKKAYQEVIGLMSNGFADTKVSGKPEYIITFVYKDGSTLINKYISYDERNYALDKNGNMDYIILKKNLSEMLQAIEKFAADPGKKPN